ncbi:MULTISPECIES: hypothetical protein [unclassified Yoonia]|uniref:hypothetical protein n=1 Tax=unclassified Yoonia TaxID=2629118 RepID=UPI002B0018B9|nr:MULTISPECIES: hypothetical protein [unclassified Yoonia]
MDLVSGLSAASQALAIIKQLRELDGASNQIELKEKLLTLQEAAFEARTALLDAKEACLTKDKEIADLKSKLKAATSGDVCPVCQEGNLKTERILPHPEMGGVGIQEKHLKCDNIDCAHAEKRTHDPSNILGKR